MYQNAKRASLRPATNYLYPSNNSPSSWAEIGATGRTSWGHWTHPTLCVRCSDGRHMSSYKRQPPDPSGYLQTTRYRYVASDALLHPSDARAARVRCNPERSRTAFFTIGRVRWGVIGRTPASSPRPEKIPPFLPQPIGHVRRDIVGCTVASDAAAPLLVPRSDPSDASDALGHRVRWPCSGPIFSFSLHPCFQQAKHKVYSLSACMLAYFQSICKG